MSATGYTGFDALRFGVVDDNVNFRRLVRTILAGLGARQVLEAAGVVDGWDLVTGGRPDILLLDWHLGEGGANGGLHLLDRIRTHPGNEIATQAVVFLSAHSTRTHVLTAIRRGANDFIVKPVSARFLHGRLMRTIESSGRYVRRNGRAMPMPHQPAAAAPPPPRRAAPPPPPPPPPADDDVLYI
jgi:CheY-like chemotaxis protein